MWSRCFECQHIANGVVRAGALQYASYEAITTSRIAPIAAVNWIRLIGWAFGPSNFMSFTLLMTTRMKERA